MKKALITGFLFLSILFVSVPNAGAVTIAELQAQINALMAQLTALQAQQGTATASPTTTSADKFCYTFIRNLKIGDGKNQFSESMVSALQTALEKEGFFISLDEKKAGSVFGKSTEAAVIKFQEKYADEILAPNGLTNGNGFVGAATRVKLNALYGCSGPTSSPTSVPKVTFTASPAVIAVGQSSTLTWSSTNATMCISPDPNLGVKEEVVGPSGSVVVNPTQNTTYYLFCYNGKSINGSIPPRADKSVMVYVNQSTGNTGDVNGDGKLDCIDTKMISEYSVGLITLAIDQRSRADVNGDGFVNIIDAQQIARNNNLSCATTTSLEPTAWIHVNGKDATSINSGQTAQISWGSTNATDCYANFTGPNGSTHLSASGSITTPPLTKTTAYTITCTNSTGKYSNEVSAVVNVVNIPAPVPTPTIGTPAPTAYLNNASDQKNAVTVTSGSSVNFVWGATNFTKCQMFKNGTLFNDGVYNSYGVNVPSYTGTFYVPNQTQNATYTLTCTGSGGSQSGSVAVSILGQTVAPTQTPVPTYDGDPYSAGYSQTSTVPLSSTEKTVTYTYPSNPCGSLMVSYTSPGSVYVGNGPVYASASTACAPSLPNTATFRVYSCSNNASLQGQAVFAFQCSPVTSSMNTIQPNYASVYESLRGLLQQLSGQLGN